MPVVTELLALLKLDDSDFTQGMNNAKKDVQGFGTRTRNAGRNVTDLGNRMTLATAPIALGMGVAIDQSRQFDKSMANINAILGITGDEASDLRKELLAYGGSTRQGPLEVADAYYSIVSGVQDASTHMAILDAATRTADAGQADLTATTSALIATMNSYGFSADEAAMVSDVFTKTVGMGVLTMDELASAFPQVTGLAAEYGISIGDLGGQMAFMTAQGFSAGNSATFLKSMITTLLNPTADLETAIHALGYESGQTMLENLGLVGSYEALKQYNNGTFSGLITNQEALQGATVLTKDEFAAFNQTFQDTVAGSTDAAKAIQDDVATWDLLQSKLGQVAIQTGDVLAPAIVGLIDSAIIPLLTEAGVWMEKNPELTQQIILITGALVVAGPIISTVGTAVSVMSTVVGVASTAWGALTGAMGLAKAGMVALIGTAGATVVALGAAVAAVAKLVHQVQIFHGQVQRAHDFANTELADEIASGDVTRKDLDDAAFKAIAHEFGGGIGGDIAARLFYSNASNSISGRATGGGVVAGQMVKVNEDGDEFWRADSSGEVIPLGDNRGGGGVVMNIYQQPGEDMMAFVKRLTDELVRSGVVSAV